MQKYNIVEAPSTWDLIKQVNEAMQKGWKPIGGIFIYEQNKFFQAITWENDLPVKEQPKEDKSI